MKREAVPARFPRVIGIAPLCLLLVLLAFGCKQETEGHDSNETSTKASYAIGANREPAELRILYAGLLETARAKDFVAFLAAHFETVETTDYLTFPEAESAGFDVTIIDHNGLDSDPSKAVHKLSRAYAHAAIVVGVPGAHICSQLSLKTAYQ